MKKFGEIILLLVLTTISLVYGTTTDYSDLVDFRGYYYDLDTQSESIGDIISSSKPFIKTYFLGNPIDYQIMWEVNSVITNEFELVRIDENTGCYDYNNTIPYELGYKYYWNLADLIPFDSDNRMLITPNNTQYDKRELDIRVDNTKVESEYTSGRYLTIFTIGAYLVDSDGNPTTNAPVAMKTLEYAVEISGDNISSSDNTAYIAINPTEASSNINLSDFYSSTANTIKVGTINLVTTRTGDAEDAQLIDLTISSTNAFSNDDNSFTFTKEDSSTVLYYKVSISENGTYNTTTFTLTDLGDLLQWQDASLDNSKGNFRTANIPLYIKPVPFSSDFFFEAGNYTSILYVNVVNPN